MLTTHYDRTDELAAWTEGLVLDWLAAGLDPDGRLALESIRALADSLQRDPSAILRGVRPDVSTHRKAP